MSPNSQPHDVLVTGLGPVSAIGCGRAPFWEALTAGRHGFGPITLCDTSQLPSRIGAEVKDFDLGDYVPREGALRHPMPRMVELALAAGALAIGDARIDLSSVDRERIGVYVGTSIGNIGEAFAARDAWRSAEGAPKHSAFTGFNHMAACVVSAAMDLRGPSHTASSGCNSGLDALGQAMMMVRGGAADAMLVIGSDSELVTAIMAALCMTNSLATRYNDRPGMASRPFDQDRDGNVVGEGAGALLIESRIHAEKRGAEAYAVMRAYRNASAGSGRRYSHDNPELDHRPAARAIAGAVQDAGWSPAEVGLVNANGSSSVLYDRLEGAALAEALGDDLPATPVHSIKSMLGQHGAGSSALQAISACLAIAEGRIPPTINHEKPDPACGPLRVVTRSTPLDNPRVVTHSIGMGGFYYSAAAFGPAD